MLPTSLRSINFTPHHPSPTATKMRDFDMYRYPYHPVDATTPPLYISMGAMVCAASAVLMFLNGPLDIFFVLFVFGVCFMLGGAFLQIRHFAETDAA